MTQKEQKHELCYIPTKLKWGSALQITVKQLLSIGTATNKKGITFVIPFRALQDGLEPTTP